jgi:hypothetical protein
MARMMIPLEIDEKQAIISLADKEKRDPRQQAALLIRRQLEKMGLLPAAAPTGQPLPVKAGQK